MERDWALPIQFEKLAATHTLNTVGISAVCSQYYPSPLAVCAYTVMQDHSKQEVKREEQSARCHLCVTQLAIFKLSKFDQKLSIYKNTRSHPEEAFFVIAGSCFREFKKNHVN